MTYQKIIPKSAPEFISKFFYALSGISRYLFHFLSNLIGFLKFAPLNGKRIPQQAFFWKVPFELYVTTVDYDRLHSFFYEHFISFIHKVEFFEFRDLLLKEICLVFFLCFVLIFRHTNRLYYNEILKIWTDD